MAKRVCCEPGCPTLIDAGNSRCTKHERARDKARGSSTERGYDAQHQRIRASYQRRMNAGKRWSCWRCGDPINPGNWTLGHCDIDRARYHGPECPRCDYATSGRDPSACPHPSHTRPV